MTSTLWRFVFPETESHYVALASLELNHIDQDGLELSKIPLPLLRPKAKHHTCDPKFLKGNSISDIVFISIASFLECLEVRNSLFMFICLSAQLTLIGW